MKKPVRNSVIDLLIASLLNLLIYVVAYLLLIAPAIPNTMEDTHSFLYILAMALHYIMALVPFFVILLVMYTTKRQPKTEYLKQMKGRTYHFTTDLKEFFQGEGKWYTGIFVALEVIALLLTIIGIPAGDILTVTMPMAMVWLLGASGLLWAILGFGMAVVSFFVVVVLGTAVRHRKWCAERLSV